MQTTALYPHHQWHFAQNHASPLAVSMNNDLIRVESDQRQLLALRVGERQAPLLTLALAEAPAITIVPVLLAGLNLVFANDQAITRIKLTGVSSALASQLVQHGVAVPDAQDEAVVCPRELFLQHADLWLAHATTSSYPLTYQISQGRRHPRRPPRPQGEVYRRFIPHLGKTFALRTLDAGQDLQRLHDWMNNPRVAAFWEEQGTLEQHQAFIASALSDPRNHPLVASLDDQPFAYFEAYWAKEDRIAPFCDVGDYDRGIHMLVGDDAFRGRHIVAAWLPSLLHYLFLADSRTQTIVCEPRVDNAKMASYLQHYGFAYRKQFDFPHKRAALLTLEREVFTGGEWFSPAL